MLNVRRKSAVPTRVLALAVAAVMTTALAACGSSDATGSSSESGKTPQANIEKAKAAVDAALKAPTSITQTEPLPKRPEPGGLVVDTSDGLPDSVRINKGVKEAAEAVGWKYEVLPKDPANPASLQTALTNALAKNPTVVSESGNPQSTFGKSVLAAYEKAGVPIILNSTYPVTPTKVIIGSSKEIPDGYVYNVALGKVLADWFIVDSKGAGKAVLENVSGYPSLTGVRDGFKKEIDALCPGCTVKVVDVSLADLAAGKLQDSVISAVRRENAGYLFFDNGGFAIGINSKLSAAGLNDVKVGGVSPQPEEVKALKAGTQHAWTGIGFKYVGWAAMDLAFRHLQGAPLTTNDAVQPTQLMTKENAEEGAWELPADGLAQFKKLWHVE